MPKLEQAGTPLSVDFALHAGADVGGTKVEIIDSTGSSLHRYETAAYANGMYGILDDYFQKLGRRPVAMTLAMAGPRDDETGEVTMTNCGWPTFSPSAAGQQYPGTRFETVNDMIGATAGVLAETGVDL